MSPPPDPRPLAPDPLARRFLKPFILALALFALAEVLALPILVVALVIMPFRDGQPAVQSEPFIFYAGLTAVVLIPLACSIYFYVRLKEVEGRLAEREQPTGQQESDAS